MKKLLVITLIATAVFACSRKTTPPADIIISNKIEEKKSSEVAIANSTETTVGKTVYTTHCGRCHGLKTVENYTAQSWENILKVMVPRAKLNDTETKDLTTYVMEHAKK